MRETGRSFRVCVCPTPMGCPCPSVPMPIRPWARPAVLGMGGAGRGYCPSTGTGTARARVLLWGRLALVYVNTKYMVADIMTKPMSTYESHARHTEVIKGQKLPEKEKPKGRRKKRKVSEIET